MYEWYIAVVLNLNFLPKGKKKIRKAVLFLEFSGAFLGV